MRATDGPRPGPARAPLPVPCSSQHVIGDSDSSGGERSRGGSSSVGGGQRGAGPQPTRILDGSEGPRAAGCRLGPRLPVRAAVQGRRERGCCQAARRWRGPGTRRGPHDAARVPRKRRQAPVLSAGGTAAGTGNLKRAGPAAWRGARPLRTARSEPSVGATGPVAGEWRGAVPSPLAGGGGVRGSRAGVRDEIRVGQVRVR